MAFVPEARLAVAVGFLVAAAVMARAARTELWARETIVDLWAMALLTLGTLAHAADYAAPASALASAADHAGSASASGGAADHATTASALSALAHPAASHHTAAPATVFELVTSAAVVLIAWLLARAAFAAVARRRTGSIRHSMLSAAAGAAQLLVMLALH